MTEPVKTSGERKKMKTWSRLSTGMRRLPTEYEIVAHGLNYHYGKKPAPFELDPRAPLNGWYLQYREGSPLRVADWNAFRDPQQLTYRAYVDLQNRRETYLDGVIERFEQDDRRPHFSDRWIGVLGRLYLPARFACHVMQMVAMYLAQISPSSYITYCCEFQAADEMRRIQRIAYRAKALSLEYDPTFGESESARAIWEEDGGWQPVRKCLEELLIAYDWGEAFVALNLCVKPLFDGVLIDALGEIAAAEGDEELALTLDDFSLDSKRSREWSHALIEFALQERDDNRAVVERWVDSWRPRMEPAIESLAGMVAECEWPSDRSPIKETIITSHDRFLEECGLHAGRDPAPV